VANERPSRATARRFGRHPETLAHPRLGTLRDFIPLWYESAGLPAHTDAPRHHDRALALTGSTGAQGDPAQCPHGAAGQGRVGPGPGYPANDARKIYDVSQIMNYAFFKLTGELLGIRLVEPTREADTGWKGMNSPPGRRPLQRRPRGDVSVIDHWLKPFSSRSGSNGGASPRSP